MDGIITRSSPWINNNADISFTGGNVGIGVTDPDTRLEVFNAGNQLKLSFDGTDNATFGVDTNGFLTITPSGGVTLLPNSSGLVIGHTAQLTIGVLAEFQVLGTAAVDSSISFGRWSGNTSPPVFRFYKSRNGAIGSNTIVTPGDGLGKIEALGDDGIDNNTASSSIRFDAEGTIGTGRVPGVIIFSTLQDQASPTLIQAMRIDSGQKVGIGTASPDQRLEVLDASNPQLRLTQLDNTIYADFQVDSNGDLIIGVDGQSNQLVLDDGGNVGIGTPTPNRLLHPEVSDAITNAVTYALRLSHISSGTVAASFGTGIEFELEGADGTNLVTGIIENILTDPDTGAEDADMIFGLALAGAVAVEVARLKSNADFNLITGGAFQINDTNVLNATTLGSAVVNSSLTNLGILTALTVGSGTKHDGYIITNAAEVQTTDATVTTLDSLTLLDENTYHIEAFVTGVKSDGTDRASYHLAVTVYRTAAGGATLQGSVTSLHTQESNAAWDADFTVSGNDLRLSVTGVAVTTIEWSSTITYMNSSN